MSRSTLDGQALRRQSSIVRQSLHAFLDLTERESYDPDNFRIILSGLIRHTVRCLGSFL